MVFPATPIAHQDPIQYGKGVPSRAAPRPAVIQLINKPYHNGPLIDYDHQPLLVLS